MNSLTGASLLALAKSIYYKYLLIGGGLLSPPFPKRCWLAFFPFFYHWFQLKTSSLWPFIPNSWDSCLGHLFSELVRLHAELSIVFVNSVWEDSQYNESSSSLTQMRRYLFLSRVQFSLFLNLKCIFPWRNILKEQEHNWKRKILIRYTLSPQTSDRKDWWRVFHSYGIVYASFPNDMHDWRAKHLFMVPCHHGKETKQTKFDCDIQTAAFFFIYKTVTVTNAVKAFVLL